MKHADVALEREYIAAALDIGERQKELCASSARLDPADCYDDGNAAVLRALYALVSRGLDASFVSLRTELEIRQEGKPALAALTECIAHGTASVQFTDMAARLATLASVRRTRERLQRALASLDDMDLESAQEHAREASGHATRAGATDVVTAHSCGWQAVAHVQAASTPESRERVIRSGFGPYDYAIRSLKSKSLHVIGGRTGCRKSSLALAMAINQAKYHHQRPGYVSCEDPPDEVGERLLAHVSDVNPQDLHESSVEPRALAHIELGLRALETLGVKFQFSLNRTLDEVLRSIRVLVTQHHCNVIYVDYLQAIKIRAKGERVDRAFAEAAQDLKSECQSLGVPLVLLSQLKRPDGAKAYAEPTMHDLKETGDLENMAESVTLLWKSSDKEDALQLGKVAKVKNSAKRPRFQLLSKTTGAISEMEMYEPPVAPVSAIRGGKDF